MTIETRPFDAAHYIESAADQADLLSDALDSGDPRYSAYALGAVARARGGMSKLARDAGMNRQALHKALSEDGNPTLDTVLKVLKGWACTCGSRRSGSRRLEFCIVFPEFRRHLHQFDPKWMSFRLMRGGGLAERGRGGDWSELLVASAIRAAAAQKAITNSRKWGMLSPRRGMAA